MDFIKLDYDTRKEEMTHHLENLERIIKDTGAILEGNCFYHHLSLNIFPELLPKQLNLYWCGKQAKTKICEIGFNAGHSTMLMLLGRDNTEIDYTIFDIGHHLYTKPCLEYIKSKFNHVKFEYIEGDSTVKMPEWINENQESKRTYDVVHVDGGHTQHCINNDMMNADLLVRKDGIIIVDDTNIYYIDKCVDTYISSGNYVELNLLTSYGYLHRILKRVT